jgi:hypothetical protein
MNGRVLSLIDRLANRRSLVVVAAVAAALHAVENLLDFPLSVPRMRALTGGHVYLDFGFANAAQAYRLLDAFGEAGRRAQLLLLPTVDVVLPLAASLFQVVAIAYAVRAAFGAASRYRGLALVGGLSLVFDYLENLAIAGLVLTYPDRHLGLAALTHALTSMKMASYGLSIGLLLILGCLALRRRRRARQPA